MNTCSTVPTANPSRHGHCRRGVATLALSASALFASPLALAGDSGVALWDQINGLSGWTVPSTDRVIVDLQPFSTQAADDLEVPAGRTWRITDVRVRGEFLGRGIGTFAITVWKDRPFHKSTQVAFYDRQFTTSQTGSMTLTLPTPLELTAGRYWISVQSQSFESVWQWSTSKHRHGASARWVNPGDGYQTGCTRPSRVVDCTDVPTPGRDLAFALYGTEQ